MLFVLQDMTDADGDRVAKVTAAPPPNPTTAVTDKTPRAKSMVSFEWSRHHGC